MSIHDGHRQRIKARFAEQGMDAFTDYQALELMLFYCIPRQDTNELAHQLIERFGSFSQVLDASIEELCSVKGVGYNAAVFLKMFPSVARYYENDKIKFRGEPLLTTEACGARLGPNFQGRCNETVFLLCIDAKGKELCCRLVGEGGINSAGVPIRRIVEISLAAKATTVVLAHNHPSGIALPSAEDVSTTQRVATALEAVDVILADHLVFADGDYTSMVQSGFYRPGMCW
jgi:DNA repair protein RadC